MQFLCLILLAAIIGTTLLTIHWLMKNDYRAAGIEGGFLLLYTLTLVLLFSGKYNLSTIILFLGAGFLYFGRFTFLYSLSSRLSLWFSPDIYFAFQTLIIGCSAVFFEKRTAVILVAVSSAVYTMVYHQDLGRYLWF